jgi:dinuclear metal center YbgI/SA1388 family protein
MGTMTVGDLAAAMERIAPVGLAESWDNVGLLLGSRSDELRGPVLLTIDVTEAVLDEAIGLSCSAIVSYHPPIFNAVKRVCDDTSSGRVVLRAARAGLAVYSPHTALDAASGGMTDWLADMVLVSRTTGDPHHADRRALRPAVVQRPSEQLKIVTFVPADALERVRLGLASAGAGRIGLYSVCSFSVEGGGTFLGEAGSNPTTGAPGRLESVREERLEMVCARQSLAIALQTLRQFHPYEEPAIDVYELIAQPRRDLGVGRRLILDSPQPLETIAARLKKNLGLATMTIGRAGGVGHESISVIGVCPGAGGELAPLALADGCQLFVTGEMKHHDVLSATAQGLSVALCGHTNTERGYLRVLCDRLGSEMAAAGLGDVRFVVSSADVDPLRPI